MNWFKRLFEPSSFNFGRKVTLRSLPKVDPNAIIECERKWEELMRKQMTTPCPTCGADISEEQDNHYCFSEPAPPQIQVDKSVADEVRAMGVPVEPAPFPLSEGDIEKMGRDLYAQYKEAMTERPSELCSNRPCSSYPDCECEKPRESATQARDRLALEFRHSRDMIINIDEGKLRGFREGWDAALSWARKAGK